LLRPREKSRSHVHVNVDVDVVVRVVGCLRLFENRSHSFSSLVNGLTRTCENTAIANLRSMCQ
jgi:hypothetical protein